MFTYLLIHYIDYNILTLHMKCCSLEKYVFISPECAYRFHEKVTKSHRYDQSSVYVDEKLCNTHALYLVI